jgi:hypothetical protein
MRSPGKNLGGLHGTDIDDVGLTAFRNHPAAEDLRTKPGCAQIYILCYSSSYSSRGSRHQGGFAFEFHFVYSVKGESTLRSNG